MGARDALGVTHDITPLKFTLELRERRTSVSSVPRHEPDEIGAQISPSPVP